MKTNNGQGKDKESEAQTLIDPIIWIPTPFKDEISLKRLITKITNIEVNITAIKPRISNKGK